MKRPLPSVFRRLLERVLECHVRLFFTETKGLSCLPSAPGRDTSPSLRTCFVPPARAVTGAGFALVLQIQGFCSGEHFLKAVQCCSETGRLFKLPPSVPAPAKCPTWCAGPWGPREPAGFPPPQSHQKQSLFSALPFPCLSGHSLAPLCDELVSGVRALIKEGVSLPATSTLTL